MTLPANIRVNIGAPFPSRVAGSAYITAKKANGLWTIGPNYGALGTVTSITDPTNTQVVIWNSSTGIYNTITASNLVLNLISSYREVTAAGDVTILPSDAVILLDKAVGAATNIILPTSASRQGVPVTVKDLKGDANVNNITFVPNGSETIDGFNAAQSAANGVALIDIALGKKTLYPLTSGGWFI